MLMSKSPDGRGIPINVHEVKDKTIFIDFNHPLAGKTLNFGSQGQRHQCRGDAGGS
jgi:FKBP-type peptidyl-prolyl cis-trans isomerase 2